HGLKLAKRSKLAEGARAIGQLCTHLFQCSVGVVLCLDESTELFASRLALMLRDGDSLTGAVKLQMRFLDDLPDCLDRFTAGHDFSGGRIKFDFGGLRALLGHQGVGTERCKPPALDQPGSGRHGSAGTHAITVPAPKVPKAGDEPLPGLEFSLQARAKLWLYHPDLREPAVKHGRRFDELAEGRRSLRQSRILRARRQAPMRRSRLIGGGVEIIAERRAKRLLIALLHPNLFDDRRPFAGILGLE